MKGAKFCILFLALLLSFLGANAAAPSVTLVFPQAGHYVSSDANVIFNVQDADNNELHLKIAYSETAGAFANTIVSDLNLDDYADLPSLDCDDSNWEDSTRCIYSWTIGEITDGNYFIDLNVWDSDYNAQDSSNASFMVDQNAPATSDNAPGGWQSNPVTVTFSCQDGAGESDCNFSRYSVDYEGWSTGSSVRVSGDGNHSVRYYSVDRAGNVESVRTTYAAILGGDHNFSIGLIMDGNYRDYNVKIPGFVSDQNVQQTSTQTITSSNRIDYAAFQGTSDIFGIVPSDPVFHVDITNVNPGTFNIYFHQRYDTNTKREIWAMHGNCIFSYLDSMMVMVRNYTFLTQRKEPAFCFGEDAEYEITVGLDYYGSDVDINGDLRLPKGGHNITISNAGVVNDKVVLNFETS